MVRTSAQDPSESYCSFIVRGSVLKGHFPFYFYNSGGGAWAAYVFNYHITTLINSNCSAQLNSSLPSCIWSEIDHYIWDEYDMGIFSWDLLLFEARVCRSSNISVSSEQQQNWKFPILLCGGEKKKVQHLFYLWCFGLVYTLLTQLCPLW